MCHYETQVICRRVVVIVMKSVRDREYDWVVERLYECWTHVAQNSAGYQSAPSPEGDLANGQGGTTVVNVRPEGQRNIVIYLDDKTKHVIPFVDSIGDTFNIGLEYGITGLKRIYP